jgi:gliding motility-associated-like protein
VEIRLGDCYSNDTVQLEVIDCFPVIPVVLKMPNIFTPNGDGKNDLFQRVEVLGMFKMKTTIFNRWREEIFRSFDAQILWDGQGFSEGTYFWVVDYEGHEGEIGSFEGVVNVSK